MAGVRSTPRESAVGAAAEESVAASLARHEHYLAHMLGLRPGMVALDLGCGIGGAAARDGSVLRRSNRGCQHQRTPDQASPQTNR